MTTVVCLLKLTKKNNFDLTSEG